MFHPLFREYFKKTSKFLEEDPTFVSHTDHDLTYCEFKEYTNECLLKMAQAIEYKPKDFLENPNFLSYLCSVAL